MECFVTRAVKFRNIETHCQELGSDICYTDTYICSLEEFLKRIVYLSYLSLSSKMSEIKCFFDNFTISISVYKPQDEIIFEE